MAVAADHVGLLLGKDAADGILGKVVGHGIDEPQVGVARLLQGAGEIGHPGGRPVAGDFGAARVVVRVKKKHAHDILPWSPAVSTKLDVRRILRLDLDQAARAKWLTIQTPSAELTPLTTPPQTMSMIAILVVKPFMTARLVKSYVP